MPKEATETEKALMKGNKMRLFGISKRQGEAATRDYLFLIIAIVGIVGIGVLAYAAISFWG